MLIKRIVLDRIATGEIDLVFRRWKKPTVKTGGQLRTSVGMLAIVDITPTRLSRITAADAKRAGHPTRAALVAELSSRRDGDLYRIEVRLSGTDPLIELRSRATLSEAEADELSGRLQRLDAASRQGPWTRDYLLLLQDNPNVRAQDLADGLGLDKPTFKNNVRKLKALGLTISHSPGYEISPRGAALIEHLDGG